MTGKHAGITLLIIAMTAGIGIAQAQSATVAEEADASSSQAQILRVITATDLTAAQRAQQAAAIIASADASVPYLSFLIQTAVERTPPADRDAMISALITAVAIRHPADAPQIIANEVSVLETPAAAKVVVTASILAPWVEIDPTAVNTVIRDTVSATKLAAVREAIADPASVVDVNTVTATATAVIAVTKPADTGPVIVAPAVPEEEPVEPEEPEETEPQATDETPEATADQPARTLRPQFVAPSIPNEITGYGGQTTPAP